MIDQTPAASLVKKSGALLIVLGIILTIIGFISIRQPLLTGVAVTILLGSLLLVSGIVQFFHGFKAASAGSKVWAVLVGVLTVIAACLILARPLFALGTLTLVVSAYFFADGLFTTIAAFQSRSEKGWGWMLFNGIITLVLGGLILKEWPLSGTWAVGLLIGIRILMSGMGILFMGSAVRGVGKATESALESDAS